MFSKIKSYLKLHYLSILIFVGIVLAISPIILSRNLSNLDEIWNYNFARNVADGLVPYRDFNMLQTPLLPFIAGLCLKLFGNELIVMRVLAILLISSIFFMIYKILKILKVHTLYTLFFLSILFILLREYICIDYNFAILLLTLILIYLEIKHFNDSNLQPSHYFVIGLLCGSCILLKQSTGIFISFASVVFPILTLLDKIDFKAYFKLTVAKILGILIPILLLMIYLICNNAFADFIDYTILGMKTFSNSISYSTLTSSQNIAIRVLSIGLPIFILISSIYLAKSKRKNLYGFYMYSLASLIVIYPISDSVHFLIGIVPFFILFAYLLFQFILFVNNLGNRRQTTDKNIKPNLLTKIKIYLYELLKCLTVLGLICYVITSCFLLNKYFHNLEKEHDILHYKNIPISKQLKNKMKEVDNYILLNKNNNVYILDSEAAIYMIALNKYNKNFDMFLKGNLGSQGEIGQIEEINKLEKGTKLLIKNDHYKLNWQTPLEVISYIKNNFNKIGEVNIFDIYEI